MLYISELASYVYTVSTCIPNIATPCVIVGVMWYSPPTSFARTLHLEQFPLCVLFQEIVYLSYKAIV